ncbi:MAG: metallophosphoesterase family protein [Sulfurospirillum cavolei]|nr:metallophosphoesterase family protein [Sulfurospirillum cavolei]
MHYVIGDVHGHFDTLKALVAKLPTETTLVFVGDLVDRGKQSAEVVRFVKDGGHLCVMGNHEEMMSVYGFNIIQAYENDAPLPLHNVWFSNGGVATLLSYGLAQLKKGKPSKVENYREALKAFKEDIAWMEKLPLYLELPLTAQSGKPVVISHAPIGVAWSMRHMDAMYSTFFRMATSSRREPERDTKIFNIFGHTPVQNGVKVREHFANVDTGCYVEDEDGFSMGKLSAYCVETGEVISMERV